MLTVVCSASAGTIAGSHLATSNSAPEPTTLHLVDPNYFAAPPQRTIVSSGGFTGFGLLAIPGDVIASGTLIALEHDGNDRGILVFREGGRETSIRYSNGSKISRIVTGATLFKGARVLVHLNEGTVVSMLHVRAEHSRGDGESP